MAETIYYAGIGSSDREEGTPPPDNIRQIAAELGAIYALRGHILRSGGASGMDSAFEAYVQPSQKQIFRPRIDPKNRLNNGIAFDRHNAYPVLDSKLWVRAEELVRPYAPHFDGRTPYVQDLFRRNMFQIFGPDLQTPVSFVVYWAPETNGVVQGGTRLAVYAARDAGIPTENLYIDSVRERALKLIAKAQERE